MKSAEQKAKKVPAIRFAGFEDEWVEKKILDLLIQTITDGPHETPDLVEDGIPFISVDAIVDNKIDFSRKRGFITEEYDFECCKKYKPELYDVYLVKSGSTVGKTAIVETTDRFNIWSPLAAMRCGDKTNPYFLYFLLQTKNLQNQVFDKASHGTQPNLSMRELEKFLAIVAQRTDEQNQIGSLLKKMEHLVYLEQKKYDKLTQVKKSMLEKMFPKEGATVPEIRFAGFTGDWNVQKASKICSITTGKSNTQDQVDGGLYPFFIRSDEPVRSNRYLYDEEAVITIGDGNIGKVFHYVNGKFDLHQRCYKMSDFKDVLGKYFYYFFSTKFYHRAIKMTAKATVDSVRLEMISEMDIQYPENLNEQQKIGSYFSRLDSLISLQQRKLEKLKNIKKSLLEKMFV